MLTLILENKWHWPTHYLKKQWTTVSWFAFGWQALIIFCVCVNCYDNPFSVANHFLLSRFSGLSLQVDTNTTHFFSGVKDISAWNCNHLRSTFWSDWTESAWLYVQATSCFSSLSVGSFSIVSLKYKLAKIAQNFGLKFSRQLCILLPLSSVDFVSQVTLSWKQYLVKNCAWISDRILHINSNPM